MFIVIIPLYTSKAYVFFAAILVVTTGSDVENQYVTNTEVIDLDNPSVSCTPWADPLFTVTRAVGGFIDNGLLICSGYIGNTGYQNTNKCFIVNQTNAYPNNFNLSVASGSSSGVMTDHGTLFITGGSQSKARVRTAPNKI